MPELHQQAPRGLAEAERAVQRAGWHVRLPDRDHRALFLLKRVREQQARDTHPPELRQDTHLLDAQRAPELYAGEVRDGPSFGLRQQHAAVLLREELDDLVRSREEGIR